MKHFLTGEVKALDGDSPSGSFEVVLSAPTLDRDGEVIDAKAFDPLPDWINFDADHGMSVTTTVGSGVPTYEGDSLIVRGDFASTPFAQDVRTLVKERHIRFTSVAFMGAKREVKEGVPHITKAELLNGAFVGIPSNRDAAIVGAKAARRDGVPGQKAVAGSFEERRDELQSLVRSAYPEAWWVYVLATFDDAVVFEIEEMDGNTARYRAPYSSDNGSLSLGTAEPVEVVEVVEPVKDAPASDTKSTTTDPEPSTAAEAAVDTPADVNVAAQARIAAARASAVLLLTD